MYNASQQSSFANIFHLEKTKSKDTAHSKSECGRIIVRAVKVTFDKLILDVITAVRCL